MVNVAVHMRMDSRKWCTMNPPGLVEILVLVVLAFLLFGPKRLPELARSVGEGIREFKKSLAGASEPVAGAEEKPKE